MPIVAVVLEHVWYRVGCDGVKSITEYSVPGDGAMVPWYRIGYEDNHCAVHVNSRHVHSVETREE